MIKNERRERVKRDGRGKGLRGAWRRKAVVMSRRDGESYYLSSGVLCGKRIFESVESAEHGGKENTSIADRAEKLLTASGGG
jgi:hypothetical protein